MSHTTTDFENHLLKQAPLNPLPPTPSKTIPPQSFLALFLSLTLIFLICLQKFINFGNKKPEKDFNQKLKELEEQEKQKSEEKRRNREEGIRMMKMGKSD